MAKNSIKYPVKCPECGKQRDVAYPTFFYAKKVAGSVIKEYTCRPCSMDIQHRSHCYGDSEEELFRSKFTDIEWALYLDEQLLKGKL